MNFLINEYMIIATIKMYSILHYFPNARMERE
jgi:hypothetical protein